MAYFKNIFGHLAGLASPNQDRTNSSNSSAKPSLTERLNTQRMSPKTRTAQWLNMRTPRNTDQHQQNQTPSPLSVKGSKVTKTIAPPKSSVKSPAKSSKRFVTLDTGSESESKNKRSSLLGTLLGFRFKNEDSPPPASDPGLEGSTLVDDDVACDADALYEGETVVQDDKGDLHTKDEHDFSDFTKEEYFLFHKLNARGAEPFLPATWRWTLDFLPDELFTADPRKAYITHTKGGEAGGIHALNRLIRLGDRTRLRIGQNIEPEPPIYDALKAYFKWTMRDSQLLKRKHVPVLSITCANRSESVDSLVSRATKRMHALGRKYRDMWGADLGRAGKPGMQYYSHEPPTVFGLMIKYSVVGFITYDARYPGKAVRNMGTWDFSEEGQDVWHAFAVAEFMCCARNYLMRLDREGLLGLEMDESDDPDA